MPALNILLSRVFLPPGASGARLTGAGGGPSSGAAGLVPWSHSQAGGPAATEQ